MCRRYAIFQYAKQAIELNCMDYLLKPVSIEELTIVLEQAVHMALEKQMRKQSDAQQLLWDSQKNIREESFWKMLVDSHHWENEMQIQEKMQAFSIDLKIGEQFLPIYLKIYTRTEDWKVYRYRIEELTKKIFLTESDVMLIRENNLSCFVIKSCTENFEKKLKV